jgi:hypothetical protein
MKLLETTTSIFECLNLTGKWFFGTLGALCVISFFAWIIADLYDDIKTKHTQQIENNE